MTHTHTFNLPIDSNATAFAYLPFESPRLRELFEYIYDQPTPVLNEICQTYLDSISRKTLLTTQKHSHIRFGPSMTNPLPELIALTITLASCGLQELKAHLPSMASVINKWRRNSAHTSQGNTPGSRFTALIIHENPSKQAQLTLLISRIAFLGDHLAEFDSSLKNVPTSSDIAPLLHALNTITTGYELHLHAINLD